MLTCTLRVGIGSYALKYTVDGKYDTTGPHFVVNPDMPIYGSMSFITGGGDFVRMW